MAFPLSHAKVKFLIKWLAVSECCVHMHGDEMFIKYIKDHERFSLALLEFGHINYSSTDIFAHFLHDLFHLYYLSQYNPRYSVVEIKQYQSITNLNHIYMDEVRGVFCSLIKPGVTQMCINNLAINGSSNGWSPVWWQAITLTHADLLSIDL